MPQYKNVHFEFLFSTVFLILNLPSLMIQMVMIPVNQFRQWHKGIALVLQILNQCIQCLCRKFCSIMAQNNRSASQMFMSGNRLNDGIHPVILPVQRVHTCNICKVVGKNNSSRKLLYEKYEILL